MRHRWLWVLAGRLRFSAGLGANTCTQNGGFCDFLIDVSVQSEQQTVGADAETRMGLGLVQLAVHRGVDPSTLSADDLLHLGAAEAKRIYQNQYYARCRCSEMPERMALLTCAPSSLQLGAEPLGLNLWP